MGFYLYLIKCSAFSLIILIKPATLVQIPFESSQFDSNCSLKIPFSLIGFVLILISNKLE